MDMLTNKGEIVSSKLFVPAIAIIATIGALTAGVASAHQGATPTVTCEKISSSYTKFPKGKHEVDYKVFVNDKSADVKGSFEGSEGTATADISHLTKDKGEVNIKAYGYWKDDGGGKTGEVKTTVKCGDKQPEQKPEQKPEVKPEEKPQAPAASNTPVVTPTPQPAPAPTPQPVLEEIQGK